jgi:hypothetical protein
MSEIVAAARSGDRSRFVAADREYVSATRRVAAAGQAFASG